MWGDQGKMWNRNTFTFHWKRKATCPKQLCNEISDSSFPGQAALGLLSRNVLTFPAPWYLSRNVLTYPAPGLHTRYNAQAQTGRVNYEINWIIFTLAYLSVTFREERWFPALTLSRHRQCEYVLTVMKLHTYFPEGKVIGSQFSTSEWKKSEKWCSFNVFRKSNRNGNFLGAAFIYHFNARIPISIMNLEVLSWSQHSRELWTLGEG